MSSRHISNSRDILNHHNAGKGDKPRTPQNEKYRANYDAIDWGRREAEAAEPFNPLEHEQSK